MSSLSVEYGYDQLQKIGITLPYFLMTRQSSSLPALEGCKKIAVEYPVEDRLIDARVALKIWVDWKMAKHQLQMRMSKANPSDFLVGGALSTSMAKAQQAAKQYQEKIRDCGIRITRQWEVIC